MGNANGAVLLPQMAEWGQHITLILIFWLFDNRQPLVLFPQPSDRPYLHIAGLIDFSPERTHYSQVINCLKLSLNENAGNLRCGVLNGGAGRTISKTARITDSCSRWSPSSPATTAALLTFRARGQNQGLAVFMLLAGVFCGKGAVFPYGSLLNATLPAAVTHPLPHVLLPPAYSPTILPPWKAPTAPVTTT